MGIVSAGATDIGRKRKTNQDSICVEKNQGFFAVADGMGGHNGGDIASELSVKIMSSYIHDHSSLEPEALMLNTIKEINLAIHQMASEKPELKGMGTTISAIQFRGPQLIIGNVGDSRVYMINNHHIFQLTRDHSFVQEKLNMGIYGREDALHDPQKNILIRSVGFEENVQVDIFQYRICKNDIFLICSDGLHGKVSDEEILKIINDNLPNPASCQLSDVEKTVRELIHLANDKGGQDNISAIVAVAKASSFR